MKPVLNINALRGFAVGRSLFEPVSLERAIHRLGFVQADPIRAPARAQDLTLRPRVKGYRAGDLDRRYPQLELEEDMFINYGFLPRAHWRLMHPRRVSWPAGSRKRAEQLLEFVREHGEVHPRAVDEHFAHGRVTNAWGGTSSATTHLLGRLHYRGVLRVVRRERGIRIYGLGSPEEDRGMDPAAQLDALVDVVVGKYAPLTASGLNTVVSRLRHAAPQWASGRKSALARAKHRLSHARVEGVDWYWPAGERPENFRSGTRDEVRLLAPFDPVVWDRPRFELLWDWAYRFEAYTPVAKRKLGYYALPLLYRDEVIGWGNVTPTTADFGFVRGSRPRDRIFRRELDDELERMRHFLRGEINEPGQDRAVDHSSQESAVPSQRPSR
jgi:uncharacterized protein YcaQ